MKNIVLAIMLVGWLTTSASGAVPDSIRFKADEFRETGSYSQRQLLKNWALTVCLGNVMKDPSDQKDANVSASAYLEFSRAKLEDFEKLRQLALKYAALKYSGSIKGNFNIMKCINLYHSRELNRLVKKLTMKFKKQ
jgi:hypothetical protein